MKKARKDVNVTPKKKVQHDQDDREGDEARKGAKSVCRPGAGGTSVLLTVRAKPGARDTKVVSVSDECVEIMVSEEPRDGMANAGITEFLSDILHVRKSAISLGKGPRSRDKIFEIEGLSTDQVLEILHNNVLSSSSS